MTGRQLHPQAIRCVIDAIRDAGLQDTGNAALAVATAHLAGQAVLESPDSLQQVLPTRFLDANRIDAAAAHRVLAPLQGTLDALASRDNRAADAPLVAVTDIDSFSKTAEVPPEQVAAFCKPLDLEEDVVERIIAKILGEPYTQKDWGGELDDLYTNHVRFRGREVTATFLLKGRGLPGRMRPKNLGKNGDQISRMTSQPAELFVVQHVNAIDAAVTHQLRDAVVARRAAGNTRAVGTVWDGVATARIGIAYGYLDPATGRLKPGALE